MKNDFDDLYEGPRLEQRKKRRKLNLLITSGITLIIILAVALIGKSFLTNESAKPVDNDVISEEGPLNKDQNEQDMDKINNDNVENDNEKIIEESPESEDVEDSVDDSPIENNSDEDQSASDEQQLTDSNVIEVIEGPWGPIKTNQEDPQPHLYEQDSANWNEQLEAIYLATNLAEDDMILWWLGNNGTNKSIATVSTKGDQEIIYRVYLEWIEGEGWIATKAELLKENDRKPSE